MAMYPLLLISGHHAGCLQPDKDHPSEPLVPRQFHFPDLTEALS